MEYIQFNEGICSACTVNSKHKPNINWEERKKLLNELLSSLKSDKIYDIIILLLSGFIVYQLLKLNSYEQEINLTYIFICGFLCSSAMILPGISGSYILLILGAYKFLLEKLNTIFVVNSDSYLYIITFVLGAIFGVLTFSRFIKWLFKSFEDKTLIVLIGFILGSVANIIPSNETNDEVFINFYKFFTNDTSLIFWSLFGFLAIIIINTIGKKNEI